MTPGAFAFGLRLVGWDGTALDVPDSPENAATFGFTGRGGTNKGGNPQVRLMALIECGTHAVIDAAFDSIARILELPQLREHFRMILGTDRAFPRDHEKR
ncbi:hypothetical protein [Streptomyces sp. NRRL S-340]|uniref:hypothetical protein n=1 Tax=Streptomyces sp. NRRL S-340 TaxID=1463901 RepID=UPI001F40EAA4|nr:hypothetical protein [Streptomyces sp. NRRL S-340]